MLRKITRIFAAFAMVCLASWASAQTVDSINFSTTYQTIRGFGTSTAWQPVLNSTQANNLFGTGTGEVGFTILRSRIDPSSTTGGSNWQTELQNAQQAQKINSQVIVFATPWTPPAAWKSNGSVDDGSLLTADYDNFANYLNAFIAYEKAGGVNLYAISVQNEPDYLPDYESCGYTGAQMDAFVAQEGSKINTKLMMPESDTFNTSESDPTLNDSNAVGYVSIVAGHTYGTNPFYYTNAKNKGKDVWMTETTYNASEWGGPAFHRRRHLGSRALSPVHGGGAVQRLCLLVDAFDVERKQPELLCLCSWPVLEICETGLCDDRSQQQPDLRRLRHVLQGQQQLCDRSHQCQQRLFEH